MSFRVRLTLFFVLIVALPMVALAVLVTQIASDSANGKTDARLDAGLRTATNLYDAAATDSGRVANKLARETANDLASIAAIRDGAVDDVLTLAREYAHRDGTTYVSIVDSAGHETVAGDPHPIAIAEVDLVDTDGQQVGTITTSTTTRDAFLRQVEGTTGEEAALLGPDGPVTGTADVTAADLPASGEANDLEHGGEDVRLAATEPLGAEQVRVALLAPAVDEGFLGSRPKIAIGLLIFFVIALIAVAFILRSLHGYVREMLGAARKIGEGDFSSRVPVSGGDEMAGLASEFNKMSGRLAEQMDELRRQRLEIEKSTRRIGDAFASGLDRQALLEILVQTAVGACTADYGLVALSGHVGSEAEAGKPTEPVQEAALVAESRALREQGPIEVSEQGAHAFASSLGRIPSTGQPVGAMTIARAEKPFNAAEREVFLYLVGQAAASVENVALHELVSEQAVTDDLTGLANSRAFRDVMEKEAARAVRFRHDVSLLMLDIDDFKKVNETYGHPAGDAVLRAIGRILRAESRGIDEPARYGGEEFVVALPETDPEGAFELAERIHARIAAERTRAPDDGREIRVTASIGVATLPAAAIDVRELIAAADGALYGAKRAGKNRVVVAPSAADGQRLDGSRDGARVAKGPAPARRK
jgi:diguanylate cyclase (GGDEF)-like protein